MARIRTIKPEFPQSESMGNVSRDARLCFVLLWTLADDSGRLRGNSRMLASLLFPYDNDAPALIDTWLGELEREGCIARYQVDGATYVEIAKWLSHQKIDKPSPSKLPAFDGQSRILANPRESSSLDQGPKDQGSKDQGGEPAPRKRSTPTPSIAKPDDVEEQTWADWLALRKAKRAPVTQTVLDGARTESQKAGMGLEAFLKVWCSRGSQGLEAEWLKPAERAAGASETAYQRSMRERMQEAAPEFARKGPTKTAENVIDFFAIEVPAKRLEIGNEPSAALG
jgi:hypothetical protein